MRIARDTCHPDPESFPEHVLIDFNELSRKGRKDAAKILRNLAENRGWQYQPPVCARIS